MKDSAKPHAFNRLSFLVYLESAALLGIRFGDKVDEVHGTEGQRGISVFAAWDSNPRTLTTPKTP